MSERGLSIFEDKQSKQGAAAPAGSAAPQSAGTKPAAAPAGATATATQTQPVVPAAGGSPQFPVARRGYDTTSVDRLFQTLTAEKKLLTSQVAELQKRNAEVTKELESLRTDASERDNPTFAGLGGKASEILRLAEEQAQEVLASARTRADEIVRKANHEAGALKNQASRDATLTGSVSAVTWRDATVLL